MLSYQNHSPDHHFQLQYPSLKRTCYNCGLFGHQARSCPRNGTPVCYNCGNYGHVSKGCSEPDHGKLCYNCGESDHLLRSCQTSANTIRRESSASIELSCPENSQVLFITPGTPGTPSNYNSTLLDSTLPQAVSPLNVICFQCGLHGHTSNYCTPYAFYDNSISTNDTLTTFPWKYNNQSCYSCGEVGHVSRKCTNGQKCYNCGEMGHVSKSCTQTQEKICYGCKNPGHILAQCESEGVSKAVTTTSIEKPRSTA